MLGLVIVGVIAAAIAFRNASGGQSSRALSRLEGKLDTLLKHHGIQFDPYADVPPPVLEALRRGKKIEAIKEYRAASGAGLREAKDYVEELQRRATPRV
ncbi:MAG TPA: ribosomal protein L7/L12 [Vicinamibacterales bacterium]|nr:ribosomal protein L7/L12 [Vicinamibacterales bacterium]